MEVMLEAKDRAAVLKGRARDERELVISGYAQAMEGRTKDLRTVCDRLAGKYSDAALQD